MNIRLYLLKLFLTGSISSLVLAKTIEPSYVLKAFDNAPKDHGPLIQKGTVGVIELEANGRGFLELMSSFNQRIDHTLAKHGWKSFSDSSPIKTNGLSPHVYELRAVKDDQRIILHVTCSPIRDGWMTVSHFQVIEKI
jgi:hypothetical protein